VSIIINSNLAASQSSLSLKRASDRLTKSIQRLSSGNRIVSPSEDAGGLAVAMKLESSLRRASATMMNTQNGISFLQMQDGALRVVGEIVDRMAELKSFYNDVSKNSEDRENYNFEFRELQKELASLKSQKFNGVSLFATNSMIGGGINIMTSDDGLGDPIELSRIGLFENFKSKFGADGKLNSGSYGEYRQLVGDFTKDGGINDANPGYATRDYQEGDVVFRHAGVDSDSGYFMAIRQVASGSRIEDTGDPASNWIRVADKSGKGFSEAYPDSPTYDMRNLKFNDQGEAVAYLKGDIIKIQAHWNDSNSFVFLKAQNDVPRNLLIDDLLLNGVGEGKYFDFIGRNQTDDQEGKPTSQFGIPNSKHSSPLAISNNDPSSLRAAMNASASNNFTPSFVQEGGSSGDIYRPLKDDWGLKQWTEGIGLYDPLDLIFDVDVAGDSFIYEVSDKVKGPFKTGDYAAGDIVFNNGSWIESPAKGYTVKSGNDLYTRSSSVVENYQSGQSISDGDVIEYDGKWYKINGSGLVDISGASEDDLNNADLSTGQLVKKNGNIEVFSAGGASPSSSAATFEEIFNDPSGLTTDVTNEVTTIEDNVIWKQWGLPISEPLTNSNFASDITSSFTDLSNKDIWSKTYYGSLNNISVNTDYQRGDNIFFEGKHYVYVSNLPSSDESLGGNDGVNDFQQLLSNGAIKELGVYVDTVGAGGSKSKSKDSFYAANQDLEFLDRLPNSGEVRTNGVQRRGDPMQNGDSIFNSYDDLLYNSLNAGNDGVYGTMDDFYSTTPYGNVALSAAHTDADLDNNVDLLNSANDLGDFSVADFVDYIQTVANFRAVNGGTMSRLNYANRILEENRINLESARGRIMDADIALESSKIARQNVIMQASAAMVTQANQMNQLVLQLLQ
jgi:flagellin-like hook-associated protein FlgL